jgi:hypothetical protein
MSGVCLQGGETLRRLRFIWHGALLATIAALGFWTATASGNSGLQVTLPTLTLPTITLPTVPITVTLPIPVPPPPPAPLPPPPIQLPPPPVVVPPPPVASGPPPGRPPSTQAPTQSAPTSGSGAQATPLASAGQSGAQAAPSDRADRPRVRLRRLRTTRTRTARGRKGRPATTITFWLSGPGRVVFLVQSGGPDCSPAGRFTVKGRSGRNEIRFTGKVRDGRLQPGTYRITPIRIRGAQPSGRHAVGVEVLPRGSVPARITTPCEPSTGPSTTTLSPAGGQGGAATGGPTSSSKRDATSKPEKKGRFQGVLSAITPPDISLPGDTGSLPWLLGVAALALLALSAGAILAYVLTFVRRARTL